MRVLEAFAQQADTANSGAFAGYAAAGFCLTLQVGVITVAASQQKGRFSD